jgi:hypothetical protein
LSELRQLQTEYDNVIKALSAVRRILKGWDEPDTPDGAALMWSARRDALVASGNEAALAEFDQSHADDLAQERQQAIEREHKRRSAPAQEQALQALAKEIATRTVQALQEVEFHETLQQAFAPCAQRLLEAAETFAVALEQARLLDHVLRSTVRIQRCNVFGDYLAKYDYELMGRTEKGDLLPASLTGVDWRRVQAVNEQFNGETRQFDTALLTKLKTHLQESHGLLCQQPIQAVLPGLANDERSVYAPQPNPPKRRPADLVPDGAQLIAFG